MRTNIDIDDALMNEALAVSGAATKREAVDRGLRELVRRHRQLRVLESRGKHKWEGDLEAMRTDY